MQEEREPKIFYKVEAGKKYRIWKNVYNDQAYYKILVTQTNYDKSKDKIYINVQFKKNVELPNETDIIINCAYENFRKNPKDPYNYIPYYVITDFEIVQNQEQIEAQALDDYRDTLYENEVTIDDNFLDWGKYENNIYRK